MKLIRLTMVRRARHCLANADKVLGGAMVSESVGQIDIYLGPEYRLELSEDEATSLVMVLAKRIAWIKEKRPALSSAIRANASKSRSEATIEPDRCPEEFACGG